MPSANDYWELIKRYFPRDQWENAYRVMMAESGGDPRAHNDRGEDSRGLFQLNVAPDANPDLGAYNLYDPEANVRLAAQMYRQRGWQPWTTAQQMGLVQAQGGGAATTSAGGGQKGTPTPLPRSMSAVEWQQFYRKRGIKNVTPVPESTSDMKDRTVKHMGQKTRFEFEDGTDMTVQWNPNGNQWEIADWGSTGKSMEKAEAEAQKPPTTRTMADGTTQQWNPATQQWDIISQKPEKAPARDIWQDPTTGAQWVIDPTTGDKVNQISPDIPDWVPGRGVPATSAKATPERVPAPASDRYIVVQNPDGTFAQVKNVNYQDPSQEPMTPYQQASLENTKAQRDLAATQQALEYGLKSQQFTFDQAREIYDQQFQNAQLAQQRLQAELSAGSQAHQQILQGAPYAMTPGMEYFPGWEPGGSAATASKVLGSKFTPLKPQPIPFDPLGWAEARMGKYPFSAPAPTVTSPNQFGQQPSAQPSAPTPPSGPGPSVPPSEPPPAPMPTAPLPPLSGGGSGDYDPWREQAAAAPPLPPLSGGGSGDYDPWREQSVQSQAPMPPAAPVGLASLSAPVPAAPAVPSLAMNAPLPTPPPGVSQEDWWRRLGLVA